MKNNGAVQTCIEVMFVLTCDNGKEGDEATNSCSAGFWCVQVVGGDKVGTWNSQPDTVSVRMMDDLHCSEAHGGLCQHM